MLSGGDSMLRLQAQVLHGMRKQEDKTDFLIVGQPQEDGVRLNIDRYVEVPRVMLEDGGFFQSVRTKFRGIFGVVFPEWYGLQYDYLHDAIRGSSGFMPVESEGGAVIFLKENENSSLTVAGKVHDVASFTSLVLGDHQWSPGSVRRRMLGDDHEQEKPFGTEKFAAYSRYDAKVGYVVTIVPKQNENSSFRQFIDSFVARPEREIEELVYPLEDSSIFYSIGKLFEHAGSMNSADIRNMVRTRAEAGTLKNLTGVVRMGIGLKQAPDGMANAIFFRLHQGEKKADLAESAAAKNESIWVGRPHKNEARTMVWEIYNSDPAFTLVSNRELLDALTSVIGSIFVSGLRHICIPKSVYDEILEKKNGNGGAPGAQGGSRTDKAADGGDVPPVTFDAPMQSQRIADGAAVGGLGVFSPVLPVQTLVAGGFGLGSGTVFAMAPAFV